jgi:hypothetical protein
MASQVDNEPQSGTDDFVHDDHGPECSQETEQGRETYRIPIDIRDSSFQVHARTEDLNAAVSNVSKMFIRRYDGTAVKANAVHERTHRTFKL